MPILADIKDGGDGIFRGWARRGASLCNDSEMASPGLPRLRLRGKGLRCGVIEVAGVHDDTGGSVTSHS
jgi:hypothetical protein